MSYLFEICFVVLQLIILVLLVIFICKYYIANKEASKKIYDLEPMDEEDEKPKKKTKD